MKKIFLTIVTALGSMALLTGCQGSKSELEKFTEGEWKLTSIESRDTVIEGEELELSYKGDVIYTFNEDGTGSVLISEQLVEGTWEEASNKIVLTCNGLDAEFEMEGDKLVSSPDGIRVVLSRNVEGIPQEEIPVEEVTEEAEEVTEEAEEVTEEAEEE